VDKEATGRNGFCKTKTRKAGCGGGGESKREKKEWVHGGDGYKGSSQRSQNKMKAVNWDDVSFANADGGGKGENHLGEKCMRRAKKKK